MRSIIQKAFGKISFLTVAFILLLLGIALHAYKQNIFIKNQSVIDSHQAQIKYYNDNNIHYDPRAIIQWLAERQHPKGYFVENPDSMDEPSQLNKNTLQATRHAILTLYRLDGIWDINKIKTIDYIYSNYSTETTNGEEIAGFYSIKGEPLGLRPTMDALLSLWRLNAIDSSRIDLHKVKSFILMHQNSDGGFWDPYYSLSDQTSCLRCTSFALSALSIINSRLGVDESDEIKSKVINFIESKWVSSEQTYSDSLDKEAHNSFDIFRAYLSLSTMGSGPVSERIKFAKTYFRSDQQIATIKEHFTNDEGIFTLRYDSNNPSMKATHLLIWLFTDLDLMDQIDQNAIVQFVLSNQNQPGEYGGDIYNTYSATSILKRLDVSTKALERPSEPELITDATPDFAPYILYLMSLGAIAFYLLQNTRQLESKTEILETKVQLDGLTGLYNRDYLESYFESHKKDINTLSMILIDIDHFKLVNDEHGHLVGDKALQRISSYISSNLRKNDILARWGGEEFTVLCPETSKEEAVQLSEKLRALIENQSQEYIGKLTCSFGVSEYSSGESFKDFFERTDKAMYISKNEGRNRVSSI